MKALFWTGLLAVDLVIPDPLPFLDEAFLGTMALKSWGDYFEERKVKSLNFGSYSRWKK